MALGTEWVFNKYLLEGWMEKLEILSLKLGNLVVPLVLLVTECVLDEVSSPWPKFPLL